MKDKVAKAYWVAWKWPEVYSDDQWVIWMSRAIAILMPAGLVAMTFLTGVPLLGWASTWAIVAIMILAILVVTIKLFYTEYHTVEDFDAREARVKEFFHGFPSITSVPLIEHEQGEWIAYGHVDPLEFISAIQLVILTVTEDPEQALVSANLVNSVGHLYATFRNPVEGHWDEGLDLVKHTAENAFPITRVEL